MSSWRLVSLSLLFLLNLLLGFMYIQPSGIKTFIQPSTNESFGESVIHLGYNTSSGQPFNYTLNPSRLCERRKDNNIKLALVILVCSSVPNFSQRLAIRQTWASIASNASSVRVGFLLGATTNTSLQAQVEEEFRTHSDIIQQDFLDSYQNLTIKSIMLLSWVDEHCRNVRHVLKTDDDMYVNIPKLVSTLLRLPGKSNAMYGVLFKKAKPNRDSKSKWYVPRNQFPGSVFPDYLSGTGYAMTRDVVPKLLEASSTVPFLVMEDIFITGLCASQAKVRRQNVRGFAYWKRPVSGCAFRDMITGHHVTVKDMHKIWRELQKRPLVCRMPKKKT